jgi:hypothetical protein
MQKFNLGEGKWTYMNSTKNKFSYVLKKALLNELKTNEFEIILVKWIRKLNSPQ